MKKLEILPVASSVSIFFGAVYAVCAATFAFFPNAGAAIFGLWLHGVQLAPLAITINRFFLGLLSGMAASWAAGAFFAVVYNMCHKHCEGKGWIKEAEQ